MTESLEERIRDLAMSASAENEDDVCDALLLTLKVSQLPPAARHGVVSAIAGLLEAAEICLSTIRGRRS